MPMIEMMMLDLNWPFKIIDKIFLTAKKALRSDSDGFRIDAGKFFC